MIKDQGSQESVDILNENLNTDKNQQQQDIANQLESKGSAEEKPVLSSEGYKQAIEESLQALKIEPSVLFFYNFHIAHLKKYRHPEMTPYIYKTDESFDIFNMAKTIPLFKRALELIRKIAKKRGSILFVGTGSQSHEAVKSAAIACDQFYISKRWLGGFLTNYETISQTIRTLHKNEVLLSSPKAQSIYTKKELSKITKKYNKSSALLSGVKNLPSLPDLIIATSHTESTAIREAYIRGIPVVCLMDSNGSPRNISHPVPGNDDAYTSVKLFCDFCAQAVIVGMQEGALISHEKAEMQQEKQAKEKQAKSDKQRSLAPYVSKKSKQRTAPKLLSSGWASNAHPHQRKEKK